MFFQRSFVHNFSLPSSPTARLVLIIHLSSCISFAELNMGFFSCMPDPASCQVSTIPPELADLVDPPKRKSSCRRRRESTSRRHSSRDLMGKSNSKTTLDSSSHTLLEHSSSLHTSMRFFGGGVDNSYGDDRAQRRANRRRSSTTNERKSMRRASSVSRLMEDFNASFRGSDGMNDHLVEMEKFAIVLQQSDQKSRNRTLRDSLLSKA